MVSSHRRTRLWTDAPPDRKPSYLTFWVKGSEDLHFWHTFLKLFVWNLDNLLLLLFLVRVVYLALVLYVLQREQNNIIYVTFKLYLNVLHAISILKMF